MNVSTTVIRKIKRGQGFGRWPAYVLGEDAYGLWLHSPLGTTYQGEAAGEIIELEVGQGNRQAGVPVVQLIPTTGWWIASWWADDATRWISVDICTPPALIGDEWAYEDLDLDPHVYPDGSVVIEDEAEFSVACDAGIITGAEKTAALIASQEIERLMRDKLEPFGCEGWKKLDEALSLALPPIKELA